MENPTANSLKELIGDGRMDLAIEALNKYTLTLSDASFQNNIVQISGRWKENERNLGLRKITNDEYEVVKNQIRHALLSLIDEVFSSKRETIFFPKLQIKGVTCSFTIILGMALLVAIIGTYKLTSQYLKNLFLENPQLTVYVQNIEGKPVHELQNVGKIIVDFGNDRRSQLIGENGRVNFGEIPKKFWGKSIPLVLDMKGYEPVDSTKWYMLTGDPIYFIIQPDESLGTVHGIIKDRSGEHFIENALILVDYDTTMITDSLGRFFMVLPPGKRKTTYNLTVKKNGYIPIEVKDYKSGTGPVEIRMYFRPSN